MNHDMKEVYAMAYNDELNTKNIKSVIEWSKDVPQYAKDFISDKMNVVSSNTLRIYTNNLNTFWSWLSSQQCNNSLSCLLNITHDDANAFIDELQNNKGFATATVLSIISTISSLYDYLVANEYTHDNPFKNVKRPKNDKLPSRILTADELKQIYNVAETGINMPKRFLSQELTHGTYARNLAIMTLLTRTDLKVSEITSINVADINLDKGILVVTKSNGSIISLQLSNETQKLFKKCLNMRIVMGVSENETALFVASQGQNKHKRISSQTIDGLVKKYAAAAGINDYELINPNTFRRTFITLSGGDNYERI